MYNRFAGVVPAPGGRPATRQHVHGMPVMDAPERWEYLAEVVTADAYADPASTYLQEVQPDWSPPRHTPAALIPQLNLRGEAGWELVSLQPISANDAASILIQGTTLYRNNGAFLCAWKRRLGEAEY